MIISVIAYVFLPTLVLVLNWKTQIASNYAFLRVMPAVATGLDEKYLA
jgi:hypothetical protein